MTNIAEREAAYLAFLREKMCLARFTGFDVPIEQINPALKPHTRDIARWILKGGNRACFASFGLHKCHGAGTPILMADGSIRAVETIREGEALMGDDGTPRRVLSLATGRDWLYRVTLKNGDSFVCNEAHVFSLKVSNHYREHRMGDVVNMPLLQFLALPDYARRNCFKHYKVPVEFPAQPVPMDAYLYGAWLGDGHQGSLAWTINSRDGAIVDRIKEFQRERGLQLREEAGRGCTTYHLTRAVRGRAEHIDEFYFVQGSSGPAGKRIDQRYLQNDRETRLQLLAGLIDTDGNLRDGCLRIGTKWTGLRDDILYLARSLGLSVSHGTQIVNGVTYFTITISGHTDMVPCLTRKKAQPRRQIKTPLVYGFDVEPLGKGEYFGFEIDGNHLYLLGDFTVTHNTATHLEVHRQIGLRFPDAYRLAVVPLGVRHEFFREVRERFTGECAMELRFIRRDSEIDDPATVYLTNYEAVREGNVTPARFRAAGLDEASILRSYGSKTYQEFLPAFASVEFKSVYTATPDPNRYKELIHYAGYLGVMDTGQALTRFFQRDSEKAGNLTLYPHKEQEFWLWVASWAVFITKPSDLGHSDEGYLLPELDVRWHEIPSDYATAGTEKNGQGLLVPDLAMGLSAAAREKRDSLPARVAKARELVTEAPEEHFILWHDLEDERHALQQAIPEAVSVWGSQDLDEREDRIIAFSDGEHRILSTKPIIAGSGCNFQRHCHREVFAGVGFKFNDFLQAVHRTFRFGQAHQVRIDIIHTESEREIVAQLQAKWRRHDQQQARMAALVKQYGLDQLAMQDTLARTIGIERSVVAGERFEVANNDAVLEAQLQPDNSVDLIVTSIPFANHYEYTPSYNDFGHTEGNAHFWRQMDFLTPELYRILKPGRIAAIHVKDRVLFGNVTGLGRPSMDFFHEEAAMHLRKHGFHKLGMVTITTDVVRENNQTYRLGYTEMCKDGTKMGVGCSEYLLVFFKPQTDLSRGYADTPVTKSKPTTRFRCTCCDFAAESWGPFVVDEDDEDDEGRCPKCGANGLKVKLEKEGGYSLARWQVDAHAHWRSSGNRLLTADEMAAMGPAKLAKFFTDDSLRHVYDYERHIAIGEQLGDRNALPKQFACLQPGSPDPLVWTDVNRMRTLNGEQSKRNVEQHVCPLQFDIVDRAIERWSMPGEVVYDPFHGLGTMGVRAIKLGRRARGSELSVTYFADQVHYLRAMEREASMPTLFDLDETEEAVPA